MTQSLPVRNCLHFLMPLRLSEWRGYDVPGVVGVLRRVSESQYEVVDVFSSDLVPAGASIQNHPRYQQWAQMCSAGQSLYFDVFLMPKSDDSRRGTVLRLIERSCGIQQHDYSSSALNAA